MLNTNHPFTPEQAAHHAKALFSPQVIGAGILAVIIDHFVHVPPYWKALAILAIGLIVLDVITGTLRAGYLCGRKKECDKNKKEHKKNLCSMSDKDGACKFNSRDLGATFIKAIVYGIFFLICVLIDISYDMALSSGTHSYMLSIMALGAISGRELLSNLENLRDICTCAHVPWPFKKVEKKIEQVISVLSPDDDEDTPVEKEDKK